jgi:sulfite exporter TauE/SafE
MIVFGLGTSPAVVSLSIAGTRLSQWLQRAALRQTLGAVLVLFGFWTGWLALAHLLARPDVHMHHHLM